ncbi:MAG TPA: hypothetical protein VGS96_16075 [Thermoanaerobaculia bacterium]|nr:hypothetical protein [Thermoanaerobaculia bacterium]
MTAKEPPPLADTTPPQLQQTISRALTKDPQQRYTAAELRDELRRISRQISQEAARPTESRSIAAGSSSSRSRRLAAIIAALAVTVNAVRMAAKLQPITYTNPAAQGDIIRAVDIAEIRPGLNEARAVK